MSARLGDRRLSADGGVRKPVNLVKACDGYEYQEETEKELNRLAHLVFGNANGQRFLAYLSNITINNVLPAETPDAVLRYREGQRFIVGVIKTRLAEGSKL